MAAANWLHETVLLEDTSVKKLMPPPVNIGYLDKCQFFALKAAKTANIFNYALTASNDYANMIS